MYVLSSKIIHSHIQYCIILIYWHARNATLNWSFYWRKCLTDDYGWKDDTL